MDLQADKVLDTAILFQGPPLKPASNPEAILLTGATGLVGPYLLKALLHRTKADIYCLMRCGDQAEGMRRLKDHLVLHALWQEEFEPRLFPVAGDLSKPLLGLTEALFTSLATKVDSIYHNGALVNFLYPYSALKAANVLGTQEVIRLAARSRLKPLHFISTVAVFFSRTHFQRGVAAENDPPQCDETLKGGYKQSKWVAEQLVLNARERGLPAVVYRPVRILGSSKTGIMDFKDTLCHLIKACIALGKYPRLDTLIEYLPADYVAEAVVHLSLQERSLGRIFHLCNPAPVSYKSFLQELNSLGYPLQEIPYDHWVLELEQLAARQPQEKIYSFLALFLRDSNNLLLQQMRFESQNSRAGLGNEVVCPPTDAKIISTYLTYFQKNGLIPAPSIS